MKLSILIMYHGGDIDMMVKTIMNCRGIVYVDEIIIAGEGVNRANGKDSLLGSVKLLTKMLSFKNCQGFHSAVESCNNEWVVMVDSQTVIGTQFIGPLLAENLNIHKIYYPEHDHPNYRYSQFLGEDIDEEHFLDNIGNHSLEQMMGSHNCSFHRDTWLKRSIDSNNMLAINYNCLKNGMVINVVKGMICKSPARVLLSDSYYKIPVDPPVEKVRMQMKPENWSACR